MTVTTGEWCVEAALWVKDWVHRGNLGALIECELVNLSSVKFRQVTLGRHDVFELCRELARSFLEQVKRTREAHGCMWDLPPDVVFSGIRSEEAEPSCFKGRGAVHGPKKHIKDAENTQAVLESQSLNLDGSDSEEEEEEEEDAEEGDKYHTMSSEGISS